MALQSRISSHSLPHDEDLGDEDEDSYNAHILLLSVQDLSPYSLGVFEGWRILVLKSLALNR